jgi:L,D-transpeptidase ErfK/SrfK
MSAHTTRLWLLLACVSLLGACSTFEGFKESWRSKPAQKAVPLAERPVEEPLHANDFVLESPAQSVVGAPQVVFTREQDTFSDLAREYGLGYDELLAANPGVDPWLPGDNTPVLLPTQYVLPDVPRQGVVLNIASKRLFYFPPVADGEPQVVRTYPIGIGRVGWETPLGDATVIAKATDPHWYVPASVRKEHAEMGNPLPSVVPPGPENPLGAHVLKLDMPGYLIHGTNQPYGVGMRVSHGCVRLYPENIELLYSLVDIGEKVTIVNEPYLVGTLRGEAYFEGHEPLEDDAVTPEERLEELLATTSLILGEDEQMHVRAIASAAAGVPVRVTRFDMDEALGRARVVRNTIEIDPDAPTLDEVREMIDEANREAEPAAYNEP